MQPDYRISEPEHKALATLSARLALAGYTLQQLPDGNYLAGRWGYTTHPLETSDAVRAFAKAAGVTA
jgi:hypothetical protein